MLNDGKNTSRNDTSRNDSRAAHICIAQVRNDTHTLVSHKRKATPCYRIPTPPRGPQSPHELQAEMTWPLALVHDDATHRVELPRVLGLRFGATHILTLGRYIS